MPIAYTLTGDEQADRRADWWRHVLGDARRQPIENGMRAHLPVTSAGPVAELAAAEQRCCPFFSFTLLLADGGLVLEVRTPAEAATMLAELFG